MSIDTEYYDRCINTLDKAYKLLLASNTEEIDFDIYRSACVKEYEIILEQSGKLLRKVLKPYFHTSKAVDQLVFKDIFRQAALKSVIDTSLCERFLEYRDNRNNTTHDYGINFAENTLKLLPDFIADAKFLSQTINRLKDVRSFQNFGQI